MPILASLRRRLPPGDAADALLHLAAHAQLSNSADLAVEGAMVLGCLLWCAGHGRGAGAWLHIAAGADNTMAARLLCTHHDSLGEFGDGTHWRAWTRHLDRNRAPGSDPAVPTVSGRPLLGTGAARDLLGRAMHELDLPLPADLQAWVDRLPWRADPYDQDAEHVPGLPGPGSAHPWAP